MKVRYFFSLIVLLCAYTLTYSKSTKPHIEISLKSITTKPSHTKMLTLSKAITLALQHRPEINAAEALIREQILKRKEAWAGYLPTVTVAYDSGTKMGNLSRRSFTEIQANQLVFSFTGPQLQSQLAEKGTSIQEYAKEILSNKIRYTLEQAFINCWLLQQQKKIILLLNVASESSFKKSTHEKKLNLLDKTDWLKKNVDRADTLFNIQSYTDDIKLANRNFAFLTGQAIELNLAPENSNATATQLILTEKIPTKLAPIQSYYLKGIANRPEIKQATKQIELEQINIDLARRATLPTLNVNAGAWHNEHSWGNSVQKNFHHIGATIQWNIFDGNISKFKEQQALARKVNATLITEQTRQNVRLDIETAYYQLSKALVSFKAKNFEYLRAKNDFFRKKQEFNLGLIAKNEFDTAASTWATAKFSWLNQKADITLKNMALNYACGYPEKHS